MTWCASCNTNHCCFIHEQVSEFHTAMPVAGDRIKPGEQSIEIRRLRASLVAEEFLELLTALGVDVHADDLEGRIDFAIFGKLKDATDLPALADACADLDYVVEGTRIAFGIFGPPIAAEVHRSNMAKLGGPRREDGKVLKPEGWTPPDIAGELQKQGWEK